jgi:hypothetical protein
MIRVFLLLGILALLFVVLSPDVTACGRCGGTTMCCSGLAFSGIVHPVMHSISWMRHAAVTSAKAAPGHVRKVKQSATTWMSNAGKTYRVVVAWTRTVVRHVLTEVGDLFVQAFHSVCSTISERVWGHSRS